MKTSAPTPDEPDDQKRVWTTADFSSGKLGTPWDTWEHEPGSISTRKEKRMKRFEDILEYDILPAVTEGLNLFAMVVICFFVLLLLPLWLPFYLLARWRRS